MCSAIALCHLLRHTIETNDVRMQTIDVKGDQIIRPDEGVRTRSKAAQGTMNCLLLILFISLLVLVFMFRILISVVYHMLL